MTENENMDNETHSIQLTPDFDNLFKQFIEEAENQASKYVRAARGANEASARFHTLTALQDVLAPLNVAAQSMTTLEAVGVFRETLADIVKCIDETRIKIQNDDGTRTPKGVNKGGLL